VDAYGEAESYLRRRVPELLGANVCAVEPIASGVWSLRVGSVQRVAKYHPFAPLTRGKPYDVLHVEREVLNALTEAGCRVPRLIALDEKAFFAFYEWVGNETLDDWAQRETTDRPERIDDLLHTQCAIDAALAVGGDRWASRVAPGGDAEALTDRWGSACQRAVWGAEALLARTRRRPLRGHIRDSIERIGGELALRAPVLGSSDYNARNIVISPQGEAFFLEFSKLSWDWTERRLVQYTTSMGSGRAAFARLASGASIRGLAGRRCAAGVGRASSFFSAKCSGNALRGFRAANRVDPCRSAARLARSVPAPAGSGRRAGDAVE